MNRPAVSYDELDERLRGDGRNDYVGMSAIDGLVTAVVAGPATVAPAVWLPNVFGGTIPQTKPGSLEERLVNTVLNRHDEVDHLLANAPGNYYPIFMHDKGKTIVDAWAIGFGLGLGLGGEAWAPILLATPKPIITPIMAVNPQLAKILFRLSPKERRKIRATAHLHIRAAVTQLYAVTRAARR
jgi:yecA family protein